MLNLLPNILGDIISSMKSSVFELIDKEIQRQKNGLELIPSENYASKDVLKALGSIFTDKYSEGYPGKRYYGGNEFVDQVERQAADLANQLFGTVYANIQPYSGSPANLAVEWALAGPGGTIMGLDLPSGGHLTHGAKVSASGTFFKSVQYHVKDDGRVDFEEVERLAKEYKPKLIWVGGTAYVYQYEFEQFAKIADSVGAFLVADIAHVAGLVVGGAHPSPTPHVDVITTTTHKTLRGPRGAMILVTPKGIKKDPDLPKKIDAAIFPGLQGGPHDHQTAAIAVALNEASQAEFKEYAQQVVRNAKTLADALIGNGLKLVGNGTENHLMLVDLTNMGYGLGYQAQVVLELAGITVNKNTIPNEQVSSFYPSGIRLGTPAVTSRGMKEDGMNQVARWIMEALNEIKGYDLPKDQTQRAQFIKDFQVKMAQNEKLKKIKKEVEVFASKFPLPGVDN